ncbi:hypothetical protein INT45_010230 [Circinella minor]|uniref:Uncharacterized protein n=1 Tax=Circinella minor TaxID=1195481 RepID=A0A8H7SET0_9FUNG|nr:hypothetical protein INT45_010230 [Circinella minor]
MWSSTTKQISQHPMASSSSIYMDQNTISNEYDENSRISQWLEEEEALLNESDVSRNTILPFYTTEQPHENKSFVYPMNNNSSTPTITTHRTPLQVMDNTIGGHHHSRPLQESPLSKGKGKTPLSQQSMLHYRPIHSGKF